jgi:Family of unknown function (DUF6152)
MTKRFATFLIPVLALFAVSAPLLAHHGSAAYDNSKMLTLTGTVTDFQFIQPHPLIFLDAKDANGNVEKWNVEMTAPNHLVHYGWNSHRIHVGDMIKVTGHAAKNGKKVLNLSKIYDASGKEIPLGPPPSADQY